ncbi:MAG: sensor histidine kinase [Eubacterium sp.]|uniref:sensor histidine kinase n=1 Tax=Eubacterium sp. TaxID=142586 RepID=UPI003991F81E
MVKTKMTDQGCIIKTQDNGRGMPKEALNHITEAFYRVDKSRSRKQGGAGLGLALCSNIVKIHNGSINFQSKEGIGTIVTVELKGGRS